MPVALKPTRTNYWGDRFITFAQRTFKGGIHTSVPPNEVNQSEELSDCLNVVLAKDGILKTRPGAERVQFTGGKVVGLGAYGNSLVWAMNGKVYVNGEEVGECNTDYDVSFVEFGGKLCILDGEQIKYFDGVSIITIDTAPQAKFGLVRGNRLWVAGDPINPSTLWYSGVNDVTDWGFSGLKLGGFFDVNPSSGSWISGLGLFFDTILIFKNGTEKKIYRLDGTTQSNFTIREVIGGTTCFSDKSVTFTQIGTLFYSIDGVYSFDGSQSVIVPIAVKILDRIAFQYPEKVKAAFWGSENLYLLAYEDEIYVLNINVGAWFRWKFPFKITAITVVKNDCYIAGDNNWIYKLSWDVYKDGTEDIESVIKTAFYDFGDAAVTKYVKYAYFFIYPYGGGTLDIKFNLDFSYLRGPYEGSEPPVQIPTELLSFEAGAGWDDLALGWDDESSAWDTVVAVPLTLKVPTSARCRSIQFIFRSPATPFSLYGIELAGAVLRPA